MNWFKWIICWWNKRHVYTFFYSKDQKAKRRCVRCGHDEHQGDSDEH